MNDPIAREFGITAADLSYGNDPRSALLAMLERVPSVSLHGFVTAILVQRETGGNLAETLDHISEVIRQRFRFERKLRTLSAEGRLSAWILIAVPFALAAVLHFTSPNYLGRLLDDPRGPTLPSCSHTQQQIGFGTYEILPDEELKPSPPTALAADHSVGLGANSRHLGRNCYRSWAMSAAVSPNVCISPDIDGRAHRPSSCSRRSVS
jgi:hypothetical protein